MDVLPHEPKRSRARGVVTRLLQSLVVITLSMTTFVAVGYLSITPVDLYSGPIVNTAPRPGLESLQVDQEFPSPGVGSSPTPLGSAPAVASDPAWSALTTSDDDSAVTWDACRPIHYVLNLSGSPQGSQQLFEQAVADTAAATGLVFINDGTTDEPHDFDRDAFQPERYGNRWAPVLVSWTTEDERQGAFGEILGHASPRAYGIDGQYSYVTGSVLFQSGPMARNMATDKGTEVALGTMRHELGHLVGLNHVEDRNELMNPDLAGINDFAAGDRAGLAAMGSGACAPKL